MLAVSLPHISQCWGSFKGEEHLAACDVTYCVPPQALKVLKTAEFMPYVVFIAAPEFDTLKAMHKAVVDAGITTKQLTVGQQCMSSPHTLMVIEPPNPKNHTHAWLYIHTCRLRGILIKWTLKFGNATLWRHSFTSKSPKFKVLVM